MWSAHMLADYKIAKGLNKTVIRMFFTKYYY